MLPLVPERCHYRCPSELWSLFPTLPGEGDVHRLRRPALPIERFLGCTFLVRAAFIYSLTHSHQIAAGAAVADANDCTAPGPMLRCRKKQGELALQRSGIPYTIIRPGGLLDEPRQGQKLGSVVAAGPDAFGLPPRRRPGSILRSSVAEACVAALVEPAASGKVVELVAERDAPNRPFAELFAGVQ